MRGYWVSESWSVIQTYASDFPRRNLSFLRHLSKYMKVRTSGVARVTWVPGIRLRLINMCNLQGSRVFLRHRRDIRVPVCVDVICVNCHVRCCM